MEKSKFSIEKLRVFVYNKRHNGSNFNSRGRVRILDIVSLTFLTNKYKRNNNIDKTTKEFKKELKTQIKCEARLTHERRYRLSDLLESTSKKENFVEPTVQTLNRYYKQLIDLICSHSNNNNTIS